MDDEHKELFRRINLLLAAMLGGKVAESMGSILDLILDYTNFHFSDEEKLMESRGYPKLQEHRKLHERFVAEFQSLKKTIIEEGVDAAVVIQVQDKVVNWLLEHIAKVDKEYGTFMAAEGKVA